jgi:hypothetical protein
MRRNATLIRTAMGAAAVLGLLAMAAPAQADPPWRHGGWHKHHRWGPPPHRYYHPPPVRYYPPPVYYAPPPVYYAPPQPMYMAPGLSFGLSIPLR